MVVPHILQNGMDAIVGRIYFLKRSISFTDYCFPNQELSRNSVTQCICPGRVLRTPGNRNIPLISILHNAPQKYFNGIR